MWKRTFIFAGLFCVAALVLIAAFPASADFGTNWSVQYYDNPSLSGDPVLTQTNLPQVNYSWGEGSPGVQVPADNFSARFSSSQTFTGGSYDFVVTADDGVRVFIDGTSVLDRFVARNQTTDRFSQNLTAGQHSIVVEYFEGTGSALLSFQWFLVNNAPPSNTNPQPTSATVVTTQVVVLGGGGGLFVTPVVSQAVATATYGGPQATVTFVRALAVRTGPYLGATYVTRLTRDQPYPILGRNRSEGVYNWYLVQTPDGRQGWSSGRYLTLNVEIAAVPEVGSVFDQIDGAPDIGVVGRTRARMALRTRPSTRTTRIGTIEYGEQVAIIGRTVQASQDQWYHIRRSTGEVGWIFGGYVTVYGEINQVPVR